MAITHDPVCKRYMRAGGGECICGELREAREDERAKTEMEEIGDVILKHRADERAKANQAWSTQLDQVQEQRDAFKFEVSVLLDALEDAITQACEENGELDSVGLSAYAHALRVLAKHNRVEITSEFGRRVIAEWVKPT